MFSISPRDMVEAEPALKIWLDFKKKKRGE